MTLTVNDLTAGMRVMLTDDSRSNYGHPAGAVGTVTRVSYGDVLVRFDNDLSGYGDLYVAPSSLTIGDLGSITSLEDYRKAVVRILWKHKTLNGWCGSAEMLATRLGVADLLPQQATVTHTVTTFASVWPGQTEDMTIRAGVKALEDPNTRYRQTSVITDTSVPYDVDEVDDRMADVTTVEDFQRIMTEVALYGARQYEVGGVADFLLECGVDRESMVEKRTVSVTCTTEVEVEVMPDDDITEAAQAALEDGYVFQYLTEDGPY